MVKYQPVRFTIFIPQEIRDTDLMERVKRLAKKRRRSLSFLVLEAIEEYLEHHDAETAQVD